jgi:hypothetical protein
MCRRGVCEYAPAFFYSLSRDLLDLAVNRRSSRNSVPVKEILALQAAYMTAEYEAMRAADQKVLKSSKEAAADNE